MAQPYDAILNYRKFYEFIKLNKSQFKDSRYLVDVEDEDKEEKLTLYTEMEIHDPLNPPTHFEKPDAIGIGGSHTLWDYRYQTVGTNFEITFEPSFEPSTLLDKARIGDGLVFAINHRDPAQVLLFKKGKPDSDGKVKFWHKEFSNPTNGFLDDDEKFLLRLQLQILPDKITENSSLHSLHPFHRRFRIQLYWINKQLIDNKFSNMFKISNQKYESLKKSCSSVYWQRYLIDGEQELRVSKVSLWGCLSKHCEARYGLIDIIRNGMKTEASPFLIEDDETDYHFSGPLNEFINMVGNLIYTPIQVFTEDLTLDGVSKFEEDLATLGWNMFACTFLKLTLPCSFSNFQKELPEQQIIGGSAVVGPSQIIGGSAVGGPDPAGGSAVGGPDPAVSNDPVITETVLTETALDRISAAYDSACLEIEKLCSEDIEPSLVVLGKRLRAAVVRIGRQYGQTSEFSMLYANLFNSVQEFALNEFRPEVDSGRIADHMYDMRQNPFCRPNSKIKDPAALEAEAERIGRLGEMLAYGYYKEMFDNVTWVNEAAESSNPFDLIIFHKEQNIKVYVEVKSTIWKGKKWFNFSKHEYNWARKRGRRYIIAHIHIDEKKKKKKNKEPDFFVTEFVDPTCRRSMPNLSMWYT